MKTLLRFLLVFSSLLRVSLCAQETSPREQFQAAVAAYQKTPSRECALKVIELYKQLDPSPAVPEEAREPFVMGTTVLNEAKDAATALKSVELLLQAVRIAPWWAEARLRLALALEAAGNYDGAIGILKLCLEFNLTEAERRDVQDKIYALKAKAQLSATKKAEDDQVAAAKKAEQDKIARAEEEKRLAVQARRDVITKIKNAVNGRSYTSYTPSYSRKADDVFGGVNQHELFGGGTHWMHSPGQGYHWKFFDERVELWSSWADGSPMLVCVGESWGPEIANMRWYMATGYNTKSETQQSWGYFNLQNGKFYFSRNFGGEPTARPRNESDFNPSKRYVYEVFQPGS